MYSGGPQQGYTGGGPYGPGAQNPTHYPEQGAYPPSQQAMYPPQQEGAYPPPQQAYPAQPQPYAAPPPAHHPQGQGHRKQHQRRAQNAQTSPEDPIGPMGDSFSDKNIRARFIRKVYLIIFTQLLVTVGFICLFIFVKPIKEWKGMTYLYYASYVVFIVLYIVLVCIKKVRRTSPANYICLALFTLALSVMCGCISSFHNTNIVLMIMGITAVVVLIVSLFSWQTKIDFTKSYCMMIAFFLSIGLFVFGLAVLITWRVTDNNTSKILIAVYGGVGALIFCFFLAIDTQLLLGNKTNSLSEEEYIYASVQIYMDIVYIFLMLLSLGGAVSN